MPLYCQLRAQSPLWDHDGVRRKSVMNSVHAFKEWKRSQSHNKDNKVAKAEIAIEKGVNRPQKSIKATKAPLNVPPREVNGIDRLSLDPARPNNPANPAPTTEPGPL